MIGEKRYLIFLISLQKGLSLTNGMKQFQIAFLKYKEKQPRSKKVINF